MIEVFDSNEWAQARLKKKRMIAVYVAIAVVTVAVNVISVLFLRPVSYGGGLAFNILTTVAFGCYSLFFFEMPFRMVNKYCRLLDSIKKGLREEGEGVFLYYEEENTVKDGVDFCGIVLEENKHNGIANDSHRILFERSHSLPELHIGDKIRYSTHANILVAYEVTERIPEELLNDVELKASIAREKAENEALARGIVASKKTVRKTR